MLEVLCKFHNEWVKMARYIGVPKHLVEDYVQRMYIKIHNSVKDEGLVLIDSNTPNKGYVWLTIRSLFYDDLRKKNKECSIEDVHVDWRNISTDSYDAEYDKALDKILDKVQAEVDSFDLEYDKDMFKSYFLSDLSYRKLSQKTGINVNRIYTACAWIKKRLTNQLSEDYEDFKNEDYDKIK